LNGWHLAVLVIFVFKNRTAKVSRRRKLYKAPLKRNFREKGAKFGCFRGFWGEFFTAEPQGSRRKEGAEDAEKGYQDRQGYR
jgi:hypothetical protein